MATRETQTLIIDTALVLFNLHGCSNVSANRIATECGISRGNLQYHFRKKEEIVQSIFQRITHVMSKDALLRQRYRELREQRIDMISRFFLALDFDLVTRNSHQVIHKMMSKSPPEMSASFG